MKKVFLGLPLLLACTVSLGMNYAALADEVMMQGFAPPLFNYNSAPITDATQQLQANPNSANYRNRARAYRQAGMRGKAVDDLNNALQISPNDPTVYLDRARNYYDEGMYKEAFKDANTAVAKDPQNADAILLRARCNNKLKKWQDAISDCGKLLTMQKNQTDAYVQRGVAYDGMGKYSNAVDDCTAAINADPNNAKAYGVRADALQEMGNYTKAIDDFTQAIKLQPSNRKALLARAWCNYKAGNDAQAADDCSKAVRFDPSMQMAMNKYIGEKYNDSTITPDADYAFGSEVDADLKNAITLYNDVLKDKPGDPNALRDRGIVYMHLAKYGEASRDFDAANKGTTPPSGEDAAKSEYQQGNADLSAGNYVSAIDHYKAAVTTSPQFGKAWHNLAIAYGYTGDYVSAELCCIHAISYRPDDWKLWNTLGFEMYNEYMHDKGDPNKLDDAGAALKHSMALNPPTDGDKNDVRKLLAAVDAYERSLAPANYVVVTTMPLN